MSDYYTRLSGNKGNFQNMMKHGFGIVTVMNARVYDVAVAKELDALNFAESDAYTIAKAYGDKTTGESKNSYRCTLDTLKIANVTMEGPSKTVTGGQYSNPLIKFGKSARLEMQDALGRSEALEALCGGIQEWKGVDDNGTIAGLHFGEDFVGPKMIVGDSFFIDQETGSQVPVKIIFYQFLPDSIFNLTQDAEGDATVFDMNGDLLTTNIKIANGEKDGTHGVFYSIVDPNQTGVSAFTFTNKTAATIDVTSELGDVQFSVNGGKDYVDQTAIRKVAQKGDIVRVQAVKKGVITATDSFIAE